MAKGAKKTFQEAAMIGGILTGKLDEEAMDEAIAKLGLKVPEKKGVSALAGKVGALMSYFETRAEEDISGPCDNCGAKSSLELSRCPFCGVGEESAEAEIDLTEEPDDDEVETVEASDERFDDLKPSTALAPPEQVVHEAQLEYPAPKPDLDKVVAEIRNLQTQGAVCAWMLAKKVADVCKSQIWKQRTKEDGTVAYKTFEQFVQAELRMTKRYANELLRLNVRFTEEEFRLIGPTKLRLVVAAPEEDQERILEKLKGGATKREIEREEFGREHKDATKAKGVKGVKVPAEKGDRITVAAILGRKTFPLFARQTGKGQDQVPAKRIEDAPWGYLDMVNDVRLTFVVLQNPNGELVGRVDIKRIQD